MLHFYIHVRRSVDLTCNEHSYVFFIKVLAKNALCASSGRKIEV